MSRPRVSVLLPVRDEERYLAECLESLSAQTLSDFEVIAVDDGSTDATPAILAAYARGDSRFRVRRQEPAGMVAASEQARAEARAPLIARMDADDVALPERLELQVAAIEEEGLAAVGGQVEYFPEPTDGMRAYADWLNSLVTVEAAVRDLWIECPLPGPGLTARAELLSYRDRCRRLGRRPDREGARARARRRGHVARRLRGGRPAQARQADPRRARSPRRPRRRLPRRPGSRRRLRAGGKGASARARCRARLLRGPRLRRRRLRA
jgi:glycosyltransferase involved in cell wall biosynthesis